MTTLSLPQIKPTPSAVRGSAVLLIGNPNAGKTSLFNRLTGMRSRTANFPGTTVEHQVGKLALGERSVELVDLPGLYSLDAVTPEERVTESVLRGEEKALRPGLVVLVLDATRLERNLFLAGQVLDAQLPTVVALTMIDEARKAGQQLDVESLSQELGVPVVPVSGRTGEGVDALKARLGEAMAPAAPSRDAPASSGPDEPASARLSLPDAPGCDCTVGCGGCPFSGRYEWAQRVSEQAHAHPTPPAPKRVTEFLDGVLTNPWAGVAVFLSMMAGVFYLIFALATVPMDLIDGGFGTLAESIGAVLPESDATSLLTDGIIGGVGGVLVFLPQICILFFFITLLEDSGYLARAAFVMEKLMRRVGLPGKAFVPMLSAHACAIPGIMAARVIDNWRDRLVTILVIPMLTCSARLPVYAMIAALLFPDAPGKAALLFGGAYLLGVVAALGTAFVLKGTILKGEASPMVLELPPFRRPSLRSAGLVTYQRGLTFVKKAGTTILLISIVLWAMATYPKADEANMPAELQQRLAHYETQAQSLDEGGEYAAPAWPSFMGESPSAEELRAEIDHLTAEYGLAQSAAGRIGRAIQPVFDPLGFDWKISVGVLSSFAAREVVISTLAILYGMGEDGEPDAVAQVLERQTDETGAASFSPAVAISLLVFFVLAMQCLPTQVVTKKETGSWKWALLQLGYMTALAYVAALIAYQTAKALGWG